jgi:hypothetical protein
MKLRMLSHIGGTHDGLPWPAPGDTVELDNEVLIHELLRSNVAVEVVAERPKAKPAAVETAEKAPPENAAKRTAKPAPRKGPK